MTLKALNAMMLVTLLGIICTGSVQAQNPTPSPQTAADATAVQPCPTLQVHSDRSTVRDGEPVIVGVTLNGGDPNVIPILSWSISAGTLLKGQGTRSIAVDSTGAGADRAITATLMIGGYAPSCAYEATATVNVAGPAKKFDEYASVSEADEIQRLDAFLPNITTADQAYVFVYAGRTSPRGQAIAELKRIKAYLVKAGIPLDRLALVDGGYKEELSHELWIVPIGAEPPRRNPTIAAKDIVFPKPAPVVKKP